MPLDPEKGLIKKASETVTGTVTPAAVVPKNFFWEDLVNSDMYGYPIHARCWEILCEHPLGAFVQTDIKELFQFLCRAIDKWHHGAFHRQDIWLNCHENEGMLHSS